MASELLHPVVFAGDECLVAELEYIAWSRFGEANPFGLSSHTHGTAYELCFIKRGTSHWWVGDDTYRIEPGDIFLTKPDELHGGVDDTMHPCELFWAVFRLDTTKPSFAMSEELVVELESELRSLSSRQAKAPEFVEGHFLRIFEALRRKERFAETVVNANMQLLLVDVVRALQASESHSKNQSAYSRRIRNTVEWIGSDIGSVHSVSEMAEYAGLKPSQFRDVFKAETGFSPIEFLNYRRVQRAKDLLRNSDLSATEIAMETGFKSSQYFATCFRKLTGVSPRRYRVSNKEDQ